MSPFWIAIPAAVAAAAIGWQLRRRAAGRRAACRDQLASLLGERRPELSLVAAEPGL